MSVREKLLSTDLDAWNHPKLVMLVSGLSAAVGATVGHLALPHVLDVPLSDGILAALAAGLGVVLGPSLLALVD